MKMDQKTLATIAMYAIPLAIAGMVGYHFLMPHGQAAPAHKARTVAFGAPPEGAGAAAGNTVPAAMAAPTAGPSAAGQPPIASSVSLGQGYGQPALGTAGMDATPMQGSAGMDATAADLSVLNEDMHTLSTQLDNIEKQITAMQSIQQTAAHTLRLRQARVVPSTSPGKTGNEKSIIDGYRLQAVGQTEAWLTDRDGNTVIATAGQTLRGGLHIEAVVPSGVVTNRGMLGF